MKTRDVQAPMRPFLNLASQLIGKYDVARVWDDFLTMAIAQFNTPAQWGNLYFDDLDDQYRQRMSQYSSKEWHIIGEMVNEYSRVMIRAILPKQYHDVFCEHVPRGILAVVNHVCAQPEDIDGYFLDTQNGGVARNRPWYDALGDFYMELTSSYKSSRLGQFFTPTEICTLMTRITLGDQDEYDEHGIPYSPNNRRNINEPACGSGRMVLSIHARKPGCSFFVLQDIDPICAKMSALNMLMHGVPCEVVCSDALAPDDYRFGYKINRWLHSHLAPDRTLQMTPHLRVLPKEEAYLTAFWQSRLREHSS